MMKHKLFLALALTAMCGATAQANDQNQDAKDVAQAIAEETLYVDCQPGLIDLVITDEDVALEPGRGEPDRRQPARERRAEEGRDRRQPERAEPDRAEGDRAEMLRRMMERRRQEMREQAERLIHRKREEHVDRIERLERQIRGLHEQLEAMHGALREQAEQMEKLQRAIRAQVELMEKAHNRGPAGPPATAPPFGPHAMMGRGFAPPPMPMPGPCSTCGNRTRMTWPKMPLGRGGFTAPCPCPHRGIASPKAQGCPNCPKSRACQACPKAQGCQNCPNARTCANCCKTRANGPNQKACPPQQCPKAPAECTKDAASQGRPCPACRARSRGAAEPARPRTPNRREAGARVPQTMIQLDLHPTVLRIARLLGSDAAERLDLSRQQRREIGEILAGYRKVMANMEQRVANAVNETPIDQRRAKVREIAGKVRAHAKKMAGHTLEKIGKVLKPGQLEAARRLLRGADGKGSGMCPCGKPSGSCAACRESGDDDDDRQRGGKRSCRGCGGDRDDDDDDDDD